MMVPKNSFLRNKKIVAGIICAVFAWLVMSVVVVLLSIAITGAFNTVHSLIAVSILIFCIRLHISLMANKYYLYKK